MSIREFVNELNSIKGELTRLRKRTSQLNARKAVLESQITEFLKAKDTPGVRFQGVAIVTEEKDRRVRRKEKEKKSDGERVLRQYGIDNPRKVLEEVVEAMRGPKESRSVVKIQNAQ